MSFHHALALYRRRAFAEASAHLVQIIPKAPHDLRPWKYLALSLIGQGQAARVQGLVETRQHQTADGLVLFFEIVEELAFARDTAAGPRRDPPTSDGRWTRSFLRNRGGTRLRA
jgi:hypothetical protein